MREVRRPVSPRLALCLALASGAGCGAPAGAPPAIAFVDAPPVDATPKLEIGSSLVVGFKGLLPRRLYEVRLYPDQDQVPARADAISFARLSTDAGGAIADFVLWYESGIVGCAPGAGAGRFAFRGFDEAAAALSGAVLGVSVHLVDPSPDGRTAPLALGVGPAARTSRLKMIPRARPLLHASDGAGCLRSAQRSQEGPVHVTGRGFAPGEPLLVAVVGGQRSWQVGDAASDVTGALGAPAPEAVQADDAGRFTVAVWPQEGQRQGVYDIIAFRGAADSAEATGRRLGEDDVISYEREPGLVLYQAADPAAVVMANLVGRPVGRAPYFQATQAFADEGDAVSGAVDPTLAPAARTAPRYAAYFVVQHRDPAGWDGAGRDNLPLVDLSGGVEIVPLKAGGLGGADVPIWPAPLKAGSYDVVVELGDAAAPGPADAGLTGRYTPSADMLDGGDQVGFTVAADPHRAGPYAVGRASYSWDDYFPSIRDVTDVDLRAVVRYPAAAAGDDAPVAPGAHPIFLIQHGNHCFCDTGNPQCSGEGVDTYTHASCPDRTPNHMGFVDLLELLASHGVIAVSIDAYDLTGNVPNWIEERGQLMLRHLELWAHLDRAEAYPTYPDPFAGRFAGHVDLSRISLSGHSRGGEAAVSAYLQNAQVGAFQIGSVSAIAPTDSLNFTLPDVPFFVILPAADYDLSDLGGLRIYDRAGQATSPPGGTTKSGIYVYGANHNFFNSVWAQHFDESYLDREDYIPADEQRRLGEAYLSAFTRIQLRGETRYLDMLRGSLRFPSVAGYKIYNMHHDRAHLSLEEGSGDAAAAAGVSARTVMFPSDHFGQVLRVGWTGVGSLTYALPPAERDLRGYAALSLRVAQTNAVVNPVSGGQDFVVELLGGGRIRGFYVGRFGEVPVPYVFPHIPESHNVMTTVRLPLSSFIMSPSGPPLGSIDAVRLRFQNPIQGDLYLDDIEFAR